MSLPAGAIRAAVESDAPGIARFYVDIRRDTVPTIHSVGEVTGWIQVHRIKRGSSFVFEQDGQVIAWMDVHQGDLDQLYVMRGHTGKGIGKQLLDHAKTLFPSGLSLHTFQANAGARWFYRREGFKEAGLGDGSGNEEGKPDVKMEWAG